VLVLCY